MVTIDDIASQASISRSSVAKILRGSPGFNDQTKQRVLRIARDLGYRPNYLSKALAGGKSMAIGVVASGLRVPITMMKLSIIETLAADAGYMAYTCSPRVDEVRHMRLAIQNLVDRRVDGMIMHSAAALDPRLQDLIESITIPLVGVNDALTPKGPSVIVRRAPAMEQAVEHLAQLGHRRVAMFISPSDIVYPSRKLEVYGQACKRWGMTLQTGRPWMVDPELGFKAHAYRIISQRMNQPRRPTALLMNNDDCALAVMAALADNGLRVPQDVSVVGFDDLPSSQYLRPALTTIHQPREEVGQAAFNLLRQLMESPTAKVESVTLDCHLVVRQSTGPAPQ